MSGFLLQLAVSNALLSAALAGLAYAVHHRGRHPVLAHALWVVVLVKVVTPPLVILPLVPRPASVVVDSGPPTAASLGALAQALSPGAPEMTAPLVVDGPALLVLLWALGSALVLAVSLLRVRRFEGLLRRTSTPAPPPIARLAQTLATSLGLRSVPAIELSRARVSPMTWWMGRRVRIVIPSALAERTDPQHLRWVLAHELAHVRRRDHLVRWLEWVACVSFWWNPVVWWARRKLREAEEASCDALVLERLDGPARSYARALLAVVEILARPATPPLALATGVGAAEALERRFRIDPLGSPSAARPSLAVREPPRDERRLTRRRGRHGRRARDPCRSGRERSRSARGRGGSTASRRVRRGPWRRCVRDGERSARADHQDPRQAGAGGTDPPAARLGRRLRGDGWPRCVRWDAGPRPCLTAGAARTTSRDDRDATSSGVAPTAT